MQASIERVITRAIHLLGAALIGTYIYSPWSSVEWFTLLVQWAVVPILSLTGVWMWKGHSIRRYFTKQR